jgi:hypothetical protein
MFRYKLKQADGTVLVDLVADSNLRNPAQAKRRAGQVFNVPEGPFVQYAGDAATSDEPVEVYWRIAESDKADVLYAAARGDYGDELLLENPYEADIPIAFVPGPPAIEERRRRGLPPTERRSVITRFVRLD